MSKKYPRLRTVDKTLPPYPLNKFPKSFPNSVGKEIIYLLASKGKPILEGGEWEAIFAECIGALWKPSNVGLDDIVKGNTAWGAKTLKSTNPSTQKIVRLISGRNSPLYSFGDNIDTQNDPNEVGEHVLDIWNTRVTSVREKYENLRTVVLIKSNDLTEVVVFEFETIRYDAELFTWEWNENGNLEGIYKATTKTKFTWQPHGSQFTIREDVPKRAVIINIRQPEAINKEIVLDAVGFDESWIKVTLREDAK